MQIVAAETRRLEDRPGQDQTVGDDNGGIGVVGGKNRLDLFVPEADRRQDVPAHAERAKSSTGEAVCFIPRPGAARRLTVDRNHVMAGADNLGERRHCEVRRSHEDDGHVMEPPGRLCKSTPIRRGQLRC